MYNCPICNREKSKGWCVDCSSDCENSTIDIYDDDLLAIAEWAANRAREFERDRTKVLVEALEKILNSQNAESVYNICDSFAIECAEEALDEYKKE